MWGDGGTDMMLDHRGGQRGGTDGSGACCMRAERHERIDIRERPRRLIS